MVKLVADFAIVKVEGVTVAEKVDDGVFLMLQTAVAGPQGSDPAKDRVRTVVAMSHASLIDMLSVLDQARRRLGLPDQGAEGQGDVVPPERSRH